MSTTTIFAVDPPHLLHSTPLTDIGKTQAIDILLSPEGDIIGFIGADSTNRRITVWAVDGSIVRTTQLDHFPKKVVHRYSSEGDTLAIYSLLMSNNPGWDDRFPGILRLSIAGDSIDKKVVWWTYPLYEICYQGHQLMSDIVLRLQLDSTPVVSMGFSYLVDCYDLTMGPSWRTEARTIDYSLNLDRKVMQWLMTKNYVDDFGGGPEQEYWGYVADKWGWDYRDYYEDPNWADVEGTRMVIGDTSTQPLVSVWGNHAGPKAFFAGQFDSSDDKKEVIYQGTGSDWLGLHPGVNRFVACYSFATGTLTEKWFTPLTGELFMELDTAEMALVGMKNCSTVVTLRCRDGKLGAPLSLGRCLKNARFVEQSTPASQLLLAGIEGETMLVFGFDQVVDAPESERPTEFRAYLGQNRPNPFNAVTHIEFSLPRATAVRLEIYNLLGQHVRTLVDEQLRAGKHSAEWDGTNDEGVVVSSGVYLYRLKADESVQSKKMILLK